MEMTTRKQKTYATKPMPIVKTDVDLAIPHDYDLERDVLGALLIESSAMERVEEYLSTRSFYNDSYALIFDTLQKLYNQHKPMSLLDVVEQMRIDGTLERVGGVVAISNIARTIASTAYIEQYAMKLHEIEVGRGIFILSSQMQEMLSNRTGDVADVMEVFEKGMTELQINTHSEVLSFYDTISNCYEFMHNDASKDSAIISTGLNGLDKILNGGFRAPDLIILGGRPSMGKTQFAVHFAEYAARQGKHVHFVSIEMTGTQLGLRILAKGVSYTNMRKGQLTDADWAQIDYNSADVQDLKITISDHPDCRQLSNIKSTARKLKRKGELDMLIIDYLQLIRTNIYFDKRYSEIGYITGELKALAKELDIPIILLAQLSRPSKGQEREEPKMEDLRESGDIEQDADIIIFPNRPAFYDADAHDEQGRSWRGRGYLLVAKQREGERNVKAYFRHDPYFKQFFDDENNF